MLLNMSKFLISETIYFQDHMGDPYPVFGINRAVSKTDLIRHQLRSRTYDYMLRTNAQTDLLQKSVQR